MLFVIFIQHTLCTTCLKRLYKAHKARKNAEAIFLNNNPPEPTYMFPYDPIYCGLHELRSILHKAKKTEKAICGQDKVALIQTDFLTACHFTISLCHDHIMLLYFALQVRYRFKSFNTLNILQRHYKDNEKGYEEGEKKLATIKISAIEKSQQLSIIFSSYRLRLGHKTCLILAELEKFQKNNHKFIDEFIMNPELQSKRFKQLFGETKEFIDSLKKFADFPTPLRIKQREVDQDIEKIESDFKKFKKY